MPILRTSISRNNNQSKTPITSTITTNTSSTDINNKLNTIGNNNIVSDNYDDEIDEEDDDDDDYITSTDDDISGDDEDTMGPPARKKFAVEGPSNRIGTGLTSTVTPGSTPNMSSATATGAATSSSSSSSTNPSTWDSGYYNSNATGTTNSLPTAGNDEIRRGAIQMANELNDFIIQFCQTDASMTTTRMFDEPILDIYSLHETQIIDLQLTTCRKLRELLPTQFREKLLQAAQMFNWIPSLLSWLNLHDRAAVQVEALLALTNIAELCAAQQQQQHQQFSSIQQQQQLNYNDYYNASSIQYQQQLQLQQLQQQQQFLQQQQQQLHQQQVAATAALMASSSSGGDNRGKAALQEAVEAANAAIAAIAPLTNPTNSNAMRTAPQLPSLTNTSSNPSSSSSFSITTGPGMLTLTRNGAEGGNVGNPGGSNSGLQVPPGSVPFPPLSFSQTLSPEAVAAFDASLASTISHQQQQQQQQHGSSSTSGAAPIPPFPAGSPLPSLANYALPPNWPNPHTNQNGGNTDNSNLANNLQFPSIVNSSNLMMAAAAAASNTNNNNNYGLGNSGGINFSSLAPPPGGVHSSISSNLFMPPPTPIPMNSAPLNISNNSNNSNLITAGNGNNSGNMNTLSSFPQQLSASSQHLLLRHADAIPTLISLLSSPSREVYEQAMWILGSIAAGDSPSATAAASNNTGGSNSGGGMSGNGDRNSGGGGLNGMDGPGGNMKSVSARDVILAAGVMNQLLRCLETHPNNLSLQRIGSWTLSNLVDGIFQSSSSPQSQQSQQSSQQQLISQSQQLLKGKCVNENFLFGKNPSDVNFGGLSNNNNGTGKGGKSNNYNNNVGNWNSMGPGNGEYTSANEIDMNMLLPVLRRLLYMTDSEVLSYVCWTLSHLCDGPSSHIAAVVTSTNANEPKGGLVPRLVELLVHPSWRVTKPALRTIGNIVCAECSEESAAAAAAAMAAASGHLGLCSSPATTDYTEVILECGAVPRLKELVTHSNREIQKEACWTLSNIAAGTVDQIQAVIESGAIPPLVNLVRDRKTDQEVRSEACWVVLNATSCGSDAQIEVLVDEGCVSVLGVLLSEASMVMMALEGLERVLQIEEAREMMRREQIENGEIEDDEETRVPVLVSAALIEKARDQSAFSYNHVSGSGFGSPHNNSGANYTAATKKADRIWKHHFVSCALCKQSFSKHRLSDASYCEECKCHVCCNCNCKIYHLDYQQELWAMTEFESEAKKNAKKTKNKKKKAKLKEKKQQKTIEAAAAAAATENKNEKNSVEDTSSNQQKSTTGKQQTNKSTTLEKSNIVRKQDGRRSPSPSDGIDDEDGEDAETANTAMKSPGDGDNQIDLVLYLQQTGSIIALSKLMDALDYGGDDYDDELDEYERKIIREQKQLIRESALVKPASSKVHTK